MNIQGLGYEFEAEGATYYIEWALRVPVHSVLEQI